MTNQTNNTNPEATVATTISPITFLYSLPTFTREEISNDLHNGFGFDAEEHAEYLGGPVSDAWVSDLRSACRAWERGY